MKLAIFGLTISSSWGNGHATILRGIFRSLHRRGHTVVFFERDVPYYAGHRDCVRPPWAQLHFYREWSEIAPCARRHLQDADVGMVTSYCPDGPAAAEAVLASNAGLRVFYDLDTPVTLQNLARGIPVPYIGPGGLGGFDLVLSYTGGRALTELTRALGARRTAPLYGCVDPDTHRPVSARAAYRADLSYMGTYAADRQEKLEALFVQTAREMPERKFLVGGSMYPPDFPWQRNIYYIRHVSPPEHPAFYCSCGFTLNVTRSSMASMGFCPSGRMFEAAACGTPLISDGWEGLDRFYEPGSEIVVAKAGGDVRAALAMPQSERRAMALRARERTLDEHTASRRARELERLLNDASSNRLKEG
jgi:spore maturation protein CgeB